MGGKLASVLTCFGLTSVGYGEELGAVTRQRLAGTESGLYTGLLRSGNARWKNLGRGQK